MIIRPRPGFFALLFTLKGSILPQVAPKVIGVALFSCVVVAAERTWPDYFPQAVGIGPFTLIGLALSIFLSFRNSACYDRWWEGRKAWGQLVVEVRGIARLLLALMHGQEAEHRAILRRLAGFAHALHAQLREGDPAAAAAPWVPPEEIAALAAKASVPDAVLASLTVTLGRARRAGMMSDVTFGVFEQKLASLSQIQATCERIRFTPLPFAYTLLLYRTAWVYCLLLPFGIAASLGWLSPIAAALVAYTFFGLDALGDELEEPFGLEPNDLPLDTLLYLVDAAVHDALGDPPPERPKQDGFLLR